jgi:hypothetical protein
VKALIVSAGLFLAARYLLAQPMVAAKVSLDPTGKKNYEVTFLFRPKAPENPPVLDAAYSAIEVVDRVLPDGSRPEDSRIMRGLARDSKGRTRVERHLFLGGQMPEGPLIVEINDIVGGYVYILDPSVKMAYRTLVANTPVQTDKSNGGTRVSTLTPSANAGGGTREELGNHVIAGQTATGTRTTRAFGSGPEGDGPPVVSVTEIWTSTKLKLAVLSKLTDSTNGTITTTLTNISDQEPSPSFFQVPDDYRVKDVEKEFEITFKLVM